jgi:hypothetical protein
MSDQELCVAYELDPDGVYTYEAIDRIEQLKEYLKVDYLDSIGVGAGASSEEFDFGEQQLFADDTETWAYTHGFEKVAEFANFVNCHLLTLFKFSRRLIKIAHREYVEDNGKMLTWPEELYNGDFDPNNVIASIHARLENHELTEKEALDYGDSIFSFVHDLVTLAHDRHNGDLGLALSERFCVANRVRWISYRGMRFRLTCMTEEEPRYGQHPWSVEAVNIPNSLRYSSVFYEPTSIPNEDAAMKWLHQVVDDFLAK